MIGLVFNQKFWPGALDVDDCWCVAALQAVNAVAPWLKLPGVKAFRAQAGNPDDPIRPDGGSIAQAATAIRALFPKLEIEAFPAKAGLKWADFAKRVKAGRPAELFLMSGELPPALRFGFAGDHAVSVAFEGGDWLIANPLAKPHSKPAVIAESVLRRAAEAKAPGSIRCVVMPTEAAAFKTHPLLPAAITGSGGVSTTKLKADIAAAKAASAEAAAKIAAL